MEPSPTRQRASRNASQEVVTKEMIDDTALQRLDNELAPMRAERASYGCSVSFNGYTDESGRSMLNATVTTPSGSMLESAMDTDNNKQTSVYLKERLKTVIMRVGVEDVVAVFSDNAANCVAAGKMLEEDEELRVFSIPCGSDTLYLLLEDIGKLVWVARTITLTKGLVHFVRAQLAAMVSDPRWAEWQAAADRTTKEAAEKIKDLVLGQAGKHSATWLLHVRQLVSIMEPIRVGLRMMDSSQPTISKVWFAVKRMEQDIKAAIVEHNIPDADQILEAVQRRTNMLLRPLHGAAALLDPEYRQHFTMRGESSAGRLDFQAVLPDFKKSAPIVQQVLGGALRRILMDQDIPAATAFAQEQIQRLLSGQVQLWELVMTGGLWRITGSQVAQAAL
ncbi:uncharacterized protein HaLaN_17044, partial [Haematococcus lacustris]